MQKSKEASVKVTPPTPLCLFEFCDRWPEVHNALFRDEHGQFYIGDSTRDLKYENHEPVTVPEALDWYADANRYACEGSSGSISELCKVAAKELRDLQTWNFAWVESQKKKAP